MHRVTNRRPNAWSFILLVTAGLMSAALASAQPAGRAGADSLASPQRLALPGNREAASIPADGVQDLRNVAASTDKVAVCDGEPDAYDYILEWVRVMSANPDSVLKSLRRPINVRGVTAATGKHGDAQAANDEQAIDPAELELIGARAQALCALQELAQRHKATPRPAVLESHDRSR